MVRNQILACPPHIARTLPRPMQELIGYNSELASGVDCQLPVERVLQESCKTDNLACACSRASKYSYLALSRFACTRVA